MINEWEHLRIEREELAEICDDVELRYQHLDFPRPYKDPLYRGISGRTRIKERDALVMRFADNSESVAGIISDSYMIIPHQWAIHRFGQTLDGMPQFGPPDIKIGLYSDGAKLSVSATFPEVQIKIGNDQLNPRAGIKNSYDLSMEWESFFGANVLRCTNGLLMFKKLSNGGGKHRMSLDLEANISQITEGMLKLDEQYQIWGKWFQTQIGSDQAMQMLETSPLSDKQVENVLALPEIGTNSTLKSEFERGKNVNGWFLSSVITQYMTHEMDDTPSRLNLEERMTAFLHKHLN